MPTPTKFVKSEREKQFEVAFGGARQESSCDRTEGRGCDTRDDL